MSGIWSKALPRESVSTTTLWSSFAEISVFRKPSLMTLIHTKLFSNNDAAIVSDILLTADDPSPKKKSLWLIAEGRVDEMNYSTVGHMQKTIFISRRCLFQWAGQMVVARSIYYFVKQRARAPFEEIKASLCREFSEKELDAVEFSIIRLNSGRIEFFGHDGNTTSHSEGIKWVSGSGAWLVDPDNHPGDKMFNDKVEGEELIDDETSDLLNRLYQGEAGAYTYDPFRAGGWYEINIVRDGVFRRVPYAVCYYDLDLVEQSGSTNPTLAIFSRYMQDRLLIHRVWGKTKASEIHVVDSFKGQFSSKVVEPDRYFLGGLHNWELVFQIAIRNGGTQVVSQITQNTSPIDEVEIADLDKPRFFASKSTVEFLKGQIERMPPISER
ncbi:MAG: hypothetical protein ABJN14_13045 [Paracoccaceae bacterium]